MQQHPSTTAAPPLLVPQPATAQPVLVNPLQLKLVEPAPEREHILQFFRYAHLPEQLQAISREFALLAGELYAVLPRNPERTVALRKLLEAKDAAVRAAIAE